MILYFNRIWSIVILISKVREIEMSPKKNTTSTINNIFEKIKRQSNNSHRFATYELDSLVKMIDSAKQIEPALLLYIPIKLVTFIECYFKDVVREFVDNDVSYANALIDRLKDIPIDMDFINFLTGKIITVGSIISQVVLVQRVDSITDVMDKLLGENVFKKSMTNYLHKQGQQKITFYSLITSLRELNNNRNIIVHENSRLVLQEDQLITYVQHTKLFLDATNHIVDELLYPNALITQTEMNDSEFKRAEELNKEIRRLIFNISVYIRSKSEKIQVKQLLIFYKQREKSIAEYGRFKAGFYEGGSIYPLIYYSALTEAREKFLAELKQIFINYEGQIEIHPLNFE